MSDTTHLRSLINLFENRIPDVTYHDEGESKVIAVLRSYKSQTYTKLAQKLARIEELEKEVKTLKAEVKASTKEDIQDLFDADDAARTRVVQTVSFIFTLTKDPKPTETPKYKDILEELEKHLTPELITVLEGLKNTMKTVTQKSPALTHQPVKEGFVGSIYTRLKNAVFKWSVRYDRQLHRLQQAASLLT